MALTGLIALCPVLGFCWGAVRLSSQGPILFRQERVGRWGKTFVLLKFRTMRIDETGPQVTADGDSRITGAGRWLRRLKLDELPQLWNVVRGEMSLVGPRPEVPRYVDLTSSLWQEVLSARPGITDPVTLALQNEEAVLRLVEGEREAFYSEVLLPLKLAGYRDYLIRRTWRTDVEVVFQTVTRLFQRKDAAPVSSVLGNQEEMGQAIQEWNCSLSTIQTQGTPKSLEREHVV